MSDIEEKPEETPPADIPSGPSEEPPTDPPADPPTVDPPPKPPKNGKGEAETMAKSTVGVVDFNTRDAVERQKYFPGCDFVANLNSVAGKSLSDCATIVANSVALGSPFAYVIAGNMLYIDATDKTKSPYVALQAVVGAV